MKIPFQNICQIYLVSILELETQHCPSGANQEKIAFFSSL